MAREVLLVKLDITFLALCIPSSESEAVEGEDAMSV
jgi:hypothetical protein